MVSELERSGPEAVGSPLRGIAVLAQDLGELFPVGADRLARRRRPAVARRLARRALSLATAIHGVEDDRPDAARAWARNTRELEKRLGANSQSDADAAACVRALARVSALAARLPLLPDEEEWQAEMIAFADEAVLAELHDACLELTAAALRLAAASTP
jgi:hypothetical protein